MSVDSPHLLVDELSIPREIAAKVEGDYERFAKTGLPTNLEVYLLDNYGIDVRAAYGPFPLKNPWGKASGQLSMTARQVEEDVAAGLGFVVLKTVIAQNESGQQSMEAWAVQEARMVAERITGKSGEAGWTISWKGRGWWQSFAEYLQLICDAQRLAGEHGTLIVPSCKYHLPNPDESAWRVDEYNFTTQKMLEAWRSGSPGMNGPMPLEKDFSPTLAGSDRATAQAKILEWLQTVPALVRDAVGREHVCLGLKMFNALFDDDFQLEMLNAIHAEQSSKPDFFIYGNRLFDPSREFDGHRGIAYGGPDLSDRNLRVMSAFQRRASGGDSLVQPLPWSATGNITTGKMALEYALRGATSFQLHTFFQLPASEYTMTARSKVEKALHELYFHPQTGFIVWLHFLANRLGMNSEVIRFKDIVGQAEGSC